MHGCTLGGDLKFVRIGKSVVLRVWAAPGPLKGPRGPLKGPRGPLKGPRGPLKGPRDPGIDFFACFFKVRAWLLRATPEGLEPEGWCAPAPPLLKDPLGPFKGPRGPFKGPRDPFKEPRGLFKGPRGPFKGPRGPFKGPR